MDYRLGMIIRDYRDYYRHPFAFSILSTRENFSRRMLKPSIMGSPTTPLYTTPPWVPPMKGN